ncbi:MULTISPECIES: DUF3991 and toprim domain-containing protein [Brucella]|uniref:DUF3991 and toprim domain-containing protein n=1 Tax=Brucella TaxID=234 RepID=UPI001FFC9BB1|nr:DUF3991 and toprim domain-containing protein [Brucella intermedia]
MAQDGQNHASRRALASFALCGVRLWSREMRKQEKQGKGERAGVGKDMERKRVEELRERVNCALVLEAAGFAIDKRESTPRAVKWRRRKEIIIVIYNGKGWFDPTSDAKGDVFGLIEWLHGVPFTTALDEAARLSAFAPTRPEWKPATPRRRSDTSILHRWQLRRPPWPGSDAWRYLHEERYIPGAIIKNAIRQNMLREGLYGTMWAAHTNKAGAITGWEERGPQWRGFSTGGTKMLFRFGNIDAKRLCVTEAAIDAMSLAALEARSGDTLYLSTGGGWSPATDMAIHSLAAQAGVSLIAATDNDPQGDVYAGRLSAIATETGCRFDRLIPDPSDWNAVLKARAESELEEKENVDWLPAVHRLRQG